METLPLAYQELRELYDSYFGDATYEGSGTSPSELIELTKNISTAGPAAMKLREFLVVNRIDDGRMVSIVDNIIRIIEADSNFVDKMSKFSYSEFQSST